MYETFPRINWFWKDLIIRGSIINWFVCIWFSLLPLMWRINNFYLVWKLIFEITVKLDSWACGIGMGNYTQPHRVNFCYANLSIYRMTRNQTKHVYTCWVLSDLSVPIDKLTRPFSWSCLHWIVNLPMKMTVCCGRVFIPGENQYLPNKIVELW